MSADTSLSPSRDTVLVCIKDHPKSISLLRSVRNRAQAAGYKWCVIYIDVSTNRNVDHGAQERMLRLLTLAEQMGAEVAHIEAESVEKGVTQFLHTEKGRIHEIILGHSQRSALSHKLRGSLGERIARRAQSQGIQVQVMPLSGQDYRQSLRERFSWINLSKIVYALIAVMVASLCAVGLRTVLDPAVFRGNVQNIGLIFMAACAFTASRFGLLPGLVASAISFLVLNYFFIYPYEQWGNLNSVTDLLNMAIFLSSAVLISLFTSQTRGYAEKAAKRELGTQALFTLYRIASVAPTRAQALEKLQDKLTRMLEMEVAFFLPPIFNPAHIEPAYPANLTLDPADSEALKLCWSETKTTGIASPFDSGTKWRFEPMLAPGGEIGVLGVRPRAAFQLDTWFGRLLTAIADQTASVLEHIELERSMEATHINEEREKLRSMLLSSVSHDLRTPLSAIMGALSIYQRHGSKLAPEKKQALIETALEEAERLDSFITNILDMTRLESGRITFKPDWYNIDDLVRDVLKRLEYRMRRHKWIFHSAPAVIEVCMDYILTGQVLYNLLDNACKYTPPGTLIELRYGTDKETFFCEVRDHGAGLPPEKLLHVFDKYARLQMKDSQIAGTGLGLSICKAIMEKQEGAIVAATHPDGGAVFTLFLPQWREVKNVQYTA